MANDEHAGLSVAVQRLRARFPGLPPQVVQQAVADARAQFAGRPIRELVPLLVERQATDMLRRTPAERCTSSDWIVTPLHRVLGVLLLGIAAVPLTANQSGQHVGVFRPAPTLAWH